MSVPRAEHTTRKRWLLAAPALLIIGLIGLLPLVIVLFGSLMEPGDYAGIQWGQWTPRAWIDLFIDRGLFGDERNIATAHVTIYLRSVVQALLATLLCFAVGFPTAYFIATRPPRRRTVWLLLITIPFWTNLLIRTYAIMLIIRDEGVLNNTLLGLGLIETPIEILFTNGAVGLGLTYAYLPLMVLPIYASLEKLDFRLVEAAYDLYADRWQVLKRIILPLAKPGIVAGCILVFIPAIGAYVIPRLLGGGRSQLLGNLIANQFGSARNWPLGFAMALFLMALVMIALLIYVRNVTVRE